MVKGACCVAASVLLFLPLAFWLHSAVRVPGREQAAIAQRFVEPQYCNPQPGERAAYLAGVAFLPASLFGLAFAWQRWGRRLPQPPGLRWGVGIALAAALAVVAWLAMLGDEGYYLQRNVFFLHPLLAVPLLASALAALRWDLGGRRLARPVLHLLVLGLAGLVFAACVFDDRGWYCGAFHFTAAFFPVVQVHLGKALLIDCASQYGLYPHLLQPLFALTGLSVRKFTVVMGLLTAGSYLALWLFLARGRRTGPPPSSASRPCSFTAGSPSCAAPISTCITSICRSGSCSRRCWSCWAVIICGVPAPGSTGRFGLFCPSGRCGTSTRACPRCSAGRPRSASGSCSPATGAALRRGLGHLAAAAGALGAAVLLYSAVIRLAYGAFPDYGGFLRYQKLYFGAGYYKYSLSLPGTWLLAAFVYLAGFAYAAFALAGRRDSPRARAVFLLSVLGVGLSSYYEGRSHPIVLLLVWWPALLLLTLFLDELLARLRRARPTWGRGPRRPRSAGCWSGRRAAWSPNSASSRAPSWPTRGRRRTVRPARRKPRTRSSSAAWSRPAARCWSPPSAAPSFISPPGAPRPTPPPSSRWRGSRSSGTWSAFSPQTPLSWCL